MAAHARSVVIRAFKLKIKGATYAAIKEALNVSESSLAEWFSGRAHRDIFLQFFPDGISPFRNSKVDSNSIKKEFDALGSSLRYIRSISEISRTGQRLWYVEFECKNGHRDRKSLSNLRKTTGCRKCLGKGLSVTEQVEKFKSVHGNLYDYSRFLRDGFHGSKEKIQILCRSHGLFLQDYTGHMLGGGCPKCAGNATKTGLELAEYVAENSDGFMKLVSYDPDAQYQSKDLVTLKCLTHSWHPEERRLVAKIVNKKFKCLTCISSRHEKMAYRELQRLGLEYDTEVPVTLANGSKAFFDLKVRLPDGDYVFLEIDGEFHFNEVQMGQTLKESRLKDARKNRYAARHGLKLIRIRYDEDIPLRIRQIFSPYVDCKLTGKGKSYDYLIKDNEHRAYQIHMRCQAGKLSKDITQEFGISPAECSRILRGTRFPDLFHSLYPDGRNPYLAAKTSGHLSLTDRQQKLAISMLRKGCSNRQLIDEFMIRYGLAVNKNLVSRLRLNNGIKSGHFIDLPAPVLKRMQIMRKSGDSLRAIREYVVKELGRDVSRPWVSSKLKVS